MNNTHTDIKNITLAGLFISVGIVLPNFFHMIGAQAGSVFLPLFYGVAIAALILPLNYSIIVALSTPIISHLISGMPPIPTLYFMLIELVAYAIFVHFIHKKLLPVFSIAIGLILSRFTYILAVTFAAKILNLPIPFVSVHVLITNILTSLPGIILQIIIIPTVYYIYQKAGNK